MGSTASHDSQTVLLVEDQAIIAMAQSNVLRSAGYSVVTALSGEEAVEVATADDQVDLVLMDVNLGHGIDGTTAAERILAQRDVPIVFLSAYSDRETVDRVRNITRYGYVVKNSGDFVLLSSVEMALNLFAAHQIAALGERRLERAQQLARIGSYERDPATRTTLWSPGVHRLLGRRDVEPSRAALLDAIHPEDLPRVDEAVRAAQQSGNVFDVEYRIIRPDGSVRWIHDRAEYWRNPQGEPVRVFGVLQDVTDLRSLRGSAELRDEELAVALEVGGVLLWRYDPGSALLSYPQRSQAEQASLIPTPSTLAELRAVVHSDDITGLEEAVDGLISGTSAQLAVTYRVHGLDGKWRRALSRGRRYVAEDTGATTIIGATMDITDPDPPRALR